MDPNALIEDPAAEFDALRTQWDREAGEAEAAAFADAERARTHELVREQATASIAEQGTSGP